MTNGKSVFLLRLTLDLNIDVQNDIAPPGHCRPGGARKPESSSLNYRRKRRLKLAGGTVESLVFDSALTYSRVLGRASTAFQYSVFK
jgi:hypothetical protein